VAFCECREFEINILRSSVHLVGFIKKKVIQYYVLYKVPFLFFFVPELSTGGRKPSSCCRAVLGKGTRTVQADSDSDSDS